MYCPCSTLVDAMLYNRHLYNAGPEDKGPSDLTREQDKDRQLGANKGFDKVLGGHKGGGFVGLREVEDPVEQVEEPSNKRSLYSAITGIKRWWGSYSKQKPKVDRSEYDKGHVILYP